MWIGIGVAILIIVVLLFRVSRPNIDESNQEEVKKVYAMPKQRRYPWFYTKDCRFFADGASRFAYSESELDNLNSNLEESVKKEDFNKAVKIADELLKVSPKTKNVWITKINAIFSDVIQKEKCWDEKLSKRVVNSCFGFLQCFDVVLEKSLDVKHILIPTLTKNVEELIKYQNKNVTKYHNFEVYNMMLNIYSILPYREVLELISNHLLEDKFDKSFEGDDYPRITIKHFLSYVDMLRTRNTSRLQETFDVRKITNCTLINDDKIDANIIAFDLNFELGISSEIIQAKFFDENDQEINFGKNPGECFIDTFEIKSSKTRVVREEIVILSDVRIARTIVSIYKDGKEEIAPVEADLELVQLKKEKNVEEALNSKQTKEVADKVEQEDDETEKQEIDEQVVKNNSQMIIYPSFENIKDIKVSGSQFVCLKNDGLVVVIGEGKSAEQVSTWRNISKIYVKDDAIYAIKEDGTVIYAGETDYDNAEYIYAWENVDNLYLADKHMLALTKNSTVRAIGNNENGQCEVEEWYDIIDVAVAFHSVGLSKDGRVYAIGENNFGECDVEGWQDIVQVAAGNFYTVGLNSMGKVVATGLNSCGQCNVSDWTNIKAIYASGNMTIGLRYDGRIVTTGKTSYRVEDAKKWNMIKDVIISDNRIIAIDNEGTVFATGKPYKSFVNNTWTNVEKVVACNDHIIALRNDGTLLSNGLLFGHFLSNDFGDMIQICENLDAKKIAMLNSQNALTCMNKDQGGINEEYPVIYGVKKADISSTHVVALKEDGTVSYYTFKDRILNDIKEWDSIVDVKAGNNICVGLNINGKVLAIGEQSYGKCNVTDWSDIVKIDAAGDKVGGLTIDGRLLVTGKNESGEFDFLKTLTNIKSFVMSDLQTMVLHNDGSVKLSFNPSGVSVESVHNWKNIKKIVVRDNNFLGLREDGLVFSTLENEAEISRWSNIDDLEASGSYTWAKLKE